MKLRAWYLKYLVPGIVLAAVVAVKGYRSWYEYKLQRQAQQLYVDFDQSMRNEESTSAFANQFTQDAYPMFKELYERTNLTKVQPTYHPRIPKIIHQIWLGSPFPEEFKRNQESWLKHHPGWEYKLWTDENVHDFGPMENQDLFDASINYGEKSDLLRYELLRRFGGVYIDVDFECLKPLDLLNHCYDFYIGIQPLDTGYGQLGIGLIGAVPGHPLLTQAIKGVKENDSIQVIIRTGPIHFTRMFYRYEQSQPTTFDAALPATYFYPKGYRQQDALPSVWLRPESFAVHHWAASWTRPSGFVKK